MDSPAAVQGPHPALPTLPPAQRTAARSCTSERKSELLLAARRGLWGLLLLHVCQPRQGPPTHRLLCLPARRWIGAELARQEKRRHQLQEQRAKAVRCPAAGLAAACRCRCVLALVLPGMCRCVCSVRPHGLLYYPRPCPAGGAGAVGAGAPGGLAVPIRRRQRAAQRAPAAAGAAAAGGAGAAGRGVAGADASVGGRQGHLDGAWLEVRVACWGRQRQVGTACPPPHTPCRHKVERCALQLLEAGFEDRQAHAAAGAPAAAGLPNSVRKLPSTVSPHLHLNRVPAEAAGGVAERAFEVALEGPGAGSTGRAAVDVSSEAEAVLQHAAGLGLQAADADMELILAGGDWEQVRACLCTWLRCAGPVGACSQWRQVPAAWQPYPTCAADLSGTSMLYRRPSSSSPCAPSLEAASTPAPAGSRPRSSCPCRCRCLCQSHWAARRWRRLRLQRQQTLAAGAPAAGALSLQSRPSRLLQQRRPQQRWSLPRLKRWLLRRSSC